MWVSRLLPLVLFVALVTACGGQSVKTFGGEAGAGSECEGGYVACDETCSDLFTDERNCGACGIRCARDERCTNARCVSTSACEPPATNCGGACVDLRNSQNHCGACFNSCPPGFICSNGACVSPCPGGQCGGGCVDFGSDPNNCGACGNVCGFGRYCSAGRCLDTCESGTFCNGVCTDISSDPFHCGGCNFECSGPDVACIGGICQSICPPEYVYCSGRCVDWRFDPANCGGCESFCANGTECVNGLCIDPCSTGTYCGGVCTDISSDPRNCGGCGIPCMSGRCAGGMCVTTGEACGDGVRQGNEEGDPPPGSLMVVPLNPMTCRYDFSRINQWYCHGSCGNWGGGEDCDEQDAHTFCKLKMDNPRSQAVSFGVVTARPEPGVCCPPPTYGPGALGCTDLGVLSSRGVGINVSVHPTNLLSSHQSGRVITSLVCTDP